VLPVVAAAAGETELAQALLQELRRVQPDISLGWIAGRAG
jgi:hypothetical protein